MKFFILLQKNSKTISLALPISIILFYVFFGSFLLRTTIFLFFLFFSSGALIFFLIKKKYYLYLKKQQNLENNFRFCLLQQQQNLENINGLNFEYIFNSIMCFWISIFGLVNISPILSFLHFNAFFSFMLYQIENSTQNFIGIYIIIFIISIGSYIDIIDFKINYKNFKHNNIFFLLEGSDPSQIDGNFTDTKIEKEVNKENKIITSKSTYVKNPDILYKGKEVSVDTSRIAKTMSKNSMGLIKTGAGFCFLGLCSLGFASKIILDYKVLDAKLKTAQEHNTQNPNLTLDQKTKNINDAIKSDNLFSQYFIAIKTTIEEKISNKFKK